MQFRLFDAAAAGSQIGSTLTDIPVTATNGVFSVTLDFGSSALNGANRWIEIAVRRNSGEAYVTLSPREQIASSPYAVRTLSAQTADTALDSQKLGGINASEYLTNSSVGNAFIKNDASGQVANFNISGNGQIGGNLAVGGTNNTVGKIQVINFNDSKDAAIFAVNNVSESAALATRGTAFFSGGTPPFNASNALSGVGVHVGSITGVPVGGGGYVFARNYSNNSASDLFLNHLGGSVGIGTQFPIARLAVDGGPAWTTNGWVHSFKLRNAAAIGWDANSSAQRFGIGQSNGGLYFFRTRSPAGTTSDPAIYDMIITDTGSVGIGTTNPQSGLELSGTGAHAQQRITDITSNNTLVLQGGAGSNMKVTGYNYGTGTAVPLYLSTDGANTILNSGGGSVAIGNVTPQRLLHVNGRARIGHIPVEASVAQVCFNAAGDLLQCGASSLKLKSDVRLFTAGLETVLRLRPIHFNWKENGLVDIGLGAEEVAGISPALVLHDSNGDVAGVKYERLNILLINAVKEQQAQIERQQERIDQLTRMLCAAKRFKQACKER